MALYPLREPVPERLQPGAVKIFKKPPHCAFRQSRLCFAPLRTLLRSRTTTIVSTSLRSIPSSLPIDDSWRTPKRVKRAKGSSCRCKMVPGSTFDFYLLGRWLLTGRSSQDASFRSTKTNNPRTNFYRIYEREASKYDTEYVRKFDQDLNTTSIFVRHSLSPLVNCLTCSYRRVYSPPSVPLSLSISARTSKSNPPRKTQQAALPPPPVSCTRVS